MPFLKACNLPSKSGFCHPNFFLHCQVNINWLPGNHNHPWESSYYNTTHVLPYRSKVSTFWACCGKVTRGVQHSKSMSLCKNEWCPTHETNGRETCLCSLLQGASSKKSSSLSPSHKGSRCSLLHTLSVRARNSSNYMLEGVHLLNGKRSSSRGPTPSPWQPSAYTKQSSSLHLIFAFYIFFPPITYTIISGPSFKELKVIYRVLFILLLQKPNEID